ncbi:hypothetical protein [Roseibacillus ishigakijimensis]|uniref:Uncharacterized protein n=1 Tax=Roseibacillus ishigakijimensis TaxID=454146 RepID=A0A934RUR2_9BACT|nr:hypothetical protein [Roseibacillus ishigakijimensis]MBK1834525.1 hypothetical protein [Roseibacillus ishigakijimensis]
MKTPSSRLFSRATSSLRLPFALSLFLFALLPEMRAAHTTNLDSMEVVNPFYLLASDEFDGDATTNAHGFESNYEVTIRNSAKADPATAYFYRIRYQIMRETGGAPVAVTLRGGGTAGTSPHSLQTLAAGLGAKTFDLRAVAIPDGLLDSKESYYLTAQLQRAVAVTKPGQIPPKPTPGPWSDVGGQKDESEPSVVFQFTNETSGDAAWNIATVPGTLNWTKDWALATNASHEGFGVTMGVFTARYDDFAAPIASVSPEVSVQFSLEAESTGTAVPLENDGLFSATASAPSYSDDGTRHTLTFFGPGLFGFTFSGQIVPTEQLDPVNERYILRATIFHQEDATGTLKEGATCELPARQLLHFNGDLFFDEVATVVETISNTPVAGATGNDDTDPEDDYLLTAIQVPVNGGHLAGRPEVSFGSGGLLQVRLYDDGHMELANGSHAAYPTNGSGANLTCLDVPDFELLNVTLRPTGAHATGFRYNLPQGLVYFPDFTANSYLGESVFTRNVALSLTPDLCLTGPLNLNLGAHAVVADEAHPLLFASQQVVVAANGELDFTVGQVRYSQFAKYQRLGQLSNAGQLDSPEMADRCSNDRYLIFAHTTAASTARFSTADDGTARLTTDFSILGDEFETHFPHKTTVNFTDPSQVAIREGKIDHNAGSSLKAATPLTVPYYQTCPDSDCGGALLATEISAKPEGDTLHFATNGGLYAQSTQIDGGAGHRLEWGKRSALRYAHRTDTFAEGSFYMPGYQLYASDNTLLKNPLLAATAREQAPAALLLAAFNEDPAAPAAYLPGEAGYRDGKGDLAGLNFEVTGTNDSGASRLGGSLEDYDYGLLPDQGNGGSKYYVRTAGVSGRQVGIDGTYDGSVKLKGFECSISQFQLTFLESTNEAEGCASWVDGSVEVKGYSNWHQAFTGLTFDCLGEPGEMTPDLSEADGKSLSYWNSSFDLKSLQFLTYPDPDVACEFLGKLAAGAKTRVSHVDQDLFGTLAFCPDGNLSTLQLALDNPEEFNGIDSQLRLPANIPLDGPNQAYNVVPASKLRFNNPESPGAPGEGFVTFAATIDIPYFRDLTVQAITTASGSEAAAFALTPGWEEGGETFFSQADFDPTHRGFPAAGAGVPDFADYRQPQGADPEVSETYLIKAEQKLFGFIPLSYPLFWDEGTRRFASNKARTQDIFVAQMEHKIDWMDAKFTNISFGATYDGLPQLKLSNWLNGEIDKAADAITDVLNTETKAAIDKGLDELDKVLEDSLSAMIDPLVDAATGSAGDPGALREIYRLLPDIAAGAASYNDFRDEVETLLTDPATLLADSIPELQALREQLDKISDVNQDAASFLGQTESALEQIIRAIDCITDGIDTTADYSVDFDGTNWEKPDLSGIPPTQAGNDKDSNLKKGLLYTKPKGAGAKSAAEEVELEIVNNLIDILLVELVDESVREIIQPLIEAAASELNEQLNALLVDVTPALLQIKDVLLTVRGYLVDIHGQVAQTGAMVTKIQDIVDDARSGEMINDILSPVLSRAWALFEQVEQAAGIPSLLASGADFQDAIDTLLVNYSEEEFIDLLKVELKDAIMQSDLVKQMQFLLRQTLYDVADRITSSLSSVLAQVTNVMKEVISDTIGALEDEINPLLGTISDYMGSGEISGFAEFNGDSLRKLRLDAKMQFEIPEEMALHVYLEILCYSSEDNFVQSGCLEPGEKMVEVRVGAKDVSVEWISECKINLEVRLSLKDFDGAPEDDPTPGDNLPPVPIGVGGTFELADGEIDFQTFKILEFGATIAVGLEECYLGAKARATFSSYEVAAGIFFGRTCTLEPLLFVDPDIGDVVSAGTTFTGAYVYGEVWIPISEVVLGVPASCLFRIDAGVGAGAFYFLEGPTYGGKVFLGVSGEALCIVSIRGEIKIILASQAGRLRGAGTGKFSAKVGWCPFCLKFSKSVKLLFDDGDWSMQ